MQLAVNIKRAKRVHQFSNTYLAESIGTSRRTLGRLLTKADNPDFTYTPLESTVEKVADFFGVEPVQAQKRLPAFVIEAI